MTYLRIINIHMPRYPVFLLLISFLIYYPAYPQDKAVIIRVVQDEPFILNDFQTTIQLKKKSFKFQVMLKNVDGVYVFASIRDSVYRFTETSPIRDFSYLKLLELRDEDIFNTNRELNISETGWSYWFYNDSADWYTFNRRVTPIDKNANVCTKVIKQLYDMADFKAIKLRDVKTPLYLFFIAVAEYDKDGNPAKELLRRKVKIDWVEGD